MATSEEEEFQKNAAAELASAPDAAANDEGSKLKQLLVSPPSQLDNPDCLLMCAYVIHRAYSRRQ